MADRSLTIGARPEILQPIARPRQGAHIKRPLIWTDVDHRYPRLSDDRSSLRNLEPDEFPIPINEPRLNFWTLQLRALRRELSPGCHARPQSNSARVSIVDTHILKTIISARHADRVILVTTECLPASAQSLLPSRDRHERAPGHCRFRATPPLGDPRPTQQSPATTGRAPHPKYVDREARHLRR
jgi:hypothetical protein